MERPPAVVQFGDLPELQVVSVAGVAAELIAGYGRGRLAIEELLAVRASLSS